MPARGVCFPQPCSSAGRVKNTFESLRTTLFNFRFKSVFGRRICRQSALRSRILFTTNCLGADRWDTMTVTVTNFKPFETVHVGGTMKRLKQITCRRSRWSISVEVSRSARGEQRGGGGEFMNDVERDQKLIPSIGSAGTSFLFGGRPPVGRAAFASVC